MVIVTPLGSPGSLHLMRYPPSKDGGFSLSNFSLSICRIYSHLSCFGKKGAPKKPTQGALDRRAPARRSHPLRNPRHALTKVLEHFNLHPVHGKNVPIFSMQIWFLRNSAGLACFGGVVHRRGRLCKKPPPVLISLVTFLFSDKKVIPLN